jgi:oligopeptide transport system permease protein
VLFFAIHLGWVNASGWYTAADRVLPALTLGLVYAAYIMRLTRAGMLEVLHQDYIRTARAKGASEFRVITRHALRGGLLPVVSFLGPATAGILTGSFIIETIFL